MSEWRSKGVVFERCVASSPRRLTLISPTSFDGAVVVADDVGKLARRVHPVAAWVGRRAPGEVVPLLFGEDEQRVGGRDAVALQAIEELADGSVVIRELLHVPDLSRTLGDVTVAVVLRVRGMQVVSVGDVRKRDRDPVLLHRRHEGERPRRGHPVEAGEALVADRVGDHVAVEVRSGPSGLMIGLTYFVPYSASNPR